MQIFSVLIVVGLLCLSVPTAAIADEGEAADEKTLLWGDTHVHSSNSFDAYLNTNLTAGPETAYRYAKGLPVVHPGHKARIQIETPLDFLVVADHAEYLGTIRHVVEKGVPREGLGLRGRVEAWYTERFLRGVIENETGRAAFSSLLPEAMDVEAAAKSSPQPAVPNAWMMKNSTWNEATLLADAHNSPGTFTALIGWERSSIPAGANLHRVVLTSADARVAATFSPYSSMQSNYPEDFWAWLEATSAATGAQFTAIPHNSNASNGVSQQVVLQGSGFQPPTITITAPRYQS